MHSQMKLGAVISYAAVIFNLIAGLIYTPWMISCIGADDYGLYTLAISVVNFFLVDFGLGKAVSRFLSKYYAEGREDVVSVFLGVVYKSYLAIAVVLALVFVVIYLNIESIYSGLTAAQVESFRGLFAIVAAYSVFAFSFASLDGVLISNERFVALNLCSLLQKVSSVALIVVCLICGRGVYALVLVNAFSSVFFTLTKLFIVRTRTSARVDVRGWDSALAREVFGFSLYYAVVSICQRFIFSIMPSILAITSNTTEVALFGLVTSLENYTYTVACALNNMFMPKVSRALAGVDEDIQSMMSRYGRIQLYIIGLIFICLVALGERFMSCWMGEGYGMLWPCAILVIAPSVIELPQLIGKDAVVASGNVKAQALVYICMAVVNVALGFVLTSFLGALGACVSICVAYALRTAGNNAIYHFKLGIDLPRFFRETYGGWLPVAVVTALAGAAVGLILPLGGWPGLVVCVALALAMYAALLWSFTMNAYEKGLVRSLVSLVLRRPM